MEKLLNVTLSNGNSANLVKIDSPDELPAALNELGFHGTQAVLVLVGGASGISEADMQSLRLKFIEVIAPVVEAQKAVVVDGGTNSGVMQMIGEAREKINASFPLLGVAPAAKVALKPGDSGTPLEPHHTHFILVPGEKYGDESAYIAGIASRLSGERPSVTLVVNGGEITFKDVEENIKVGRPILTIDGSGRTADKLAAALGGEPTDERAKHLVEIGNVQAVDLMAGSLPLANVIREMLSGFNQDE